MNKKILFLTIIVFIIMICIPIVTSINISQEKSIKLSDLKIIVAGCKGDEYSWRKNYFEAFRIIREKALSSVLYPQISGIPCQVEIDADSELVKALLSFSDMKKEINIRE